jgi:hypothetical protein
MTRSELEDSKKQRERNGVKGNQTKYVSSAHKITFKLGTVQTIKFNTTMHISLIISNMIRQKQRALYALTLPMTVKDSSFVSNGLDSGTSNNATGEAGSEPSPRRSPA